MRPERWPDNLEGLAAKSAAGNEDHESLPGHTWLVLQRTKDLINLRPDLPSRLGAPRFWDILVRGAIIHDWGKAAQGFQTALKTRTPWGHRHEVLSLAFVDWVRAGLDDGEATWLAAVVAFHHRSAQHIYELYRRARDPRDDPVMDLLSSMDPEAWKGLAAWTGTLGEWIESLGLAHVTDLKNIAAKTAEVTSSDAGQAAAGRIHYWLSACRRMLFDSRQSGNDKGVPLLALAGFLMQADRTASAHTGQLEPAHASPEAILTRAQIDAGQLYDHQRKAASCPGSALLTAPTGSGKTEAALLWACQRRDGVPAPRVYYTLPYRASMNAMHDRLSHLFPDRVAVSHGKGLLALYRRFMALDYGPEEAAQKAKLERDMARLQVKPFHVLSPYQILKAFYRLPGYEMLLSNFFDARFIFDEIHAYEPGRLALIMESVRFLKERCGAEFFIMSATFPGPALERLQDVIHGEHIVASKAVFDKFVRHRVHVRNGSLFDAVGEVIDSFHQGQSVLVTCNTVANAQAVYDTLCHNLPHLRGDRIILVHGRFNSRDRTAKEHAVAIRAGLNGVRPTPVIVVGTQVVEVSLNLDLDVIFSEPAPLEALVQRFGRVNRKGRLGLAPVNVFKEPGDGQGVYDGSLVAAALECLQEVDGLPITDRHVQDWLDRIYQGPVLAKWQQEFEAMGREFREAFLNTLRPFEPDKTLQKAFYRMFDGIEVLPLSLRNQYQVLFQQEPLTAAELLVPISWHQFLALQRKGLILEDVETPSEPPIVNTPYDPELGLLL